MAGRRQQQQLVAKHASYRFFSPPAAFSAAGTDADEFDESDVWGYSSVDPRKAEAPKPTAASSRPSAAQSKGGDGRRGDRVAPPASSLPVRIPDWSKVLGSYYSSGGGGGSSSSRKGWYGAEVDDKEDGDISAGPVIPPHELLCRSRAASCSVHEGVGRTLKGRDLSRVRNAIWEKTGFQD